MTTSTDLIFQALFLVGFCAMIVDGTIDPRELSAHRALLMKTPLQDEAAYNTMADYHIEILNTESESFLLGYFQALKDNAISAEEALLLLQGVHCVIRADDEVTPAELEFFEHTRIQLGVSARALEESLHQADPSVEEGKTLDIPRSDEAITKDTKSLEIDAISNFVRSLKLPKFNFITK